MNPDRRRFLKQFVAGGVGLGAVATVDGFLYEPEDPVVERITIRLPRLPESFDGFRIAQMTDFHFGPYIGKPQIERAVQITRSLQPNLVVLTGDFVSAPLFQSHGIAGARHAEPCAQVLEQLTECPMLAVLGNHDHWNGADLVQESLEHHGIKVLRNASLPLERDGKRLWIVGVDDVIEHAADVRKSFAGVPPEELQIVVVHEPDFADEIARHPADLQLSGHSHGGQVWIPGLGAPILPELATKYPRGLYRISNLQLYTNRGIGVITPPVRLNCRPEITLITLVGKT